MEASLTALLRSRRHVDADDKDGAKLRKAVKCAIETLETLTDPDDETLMEARGLQIPLDGESEAALLPKCFQAAAELVELLLVAAVEKEAMLRWVAACVSRTCEDILYFGILHFLGGCVPRLAGRPLLQETLLVAASLCPIIAVPRLRSLALQDTHTFS